MLIQVSTTSQTLLMLLDLLMQRMATLICTLFPPALLDQPWAVFSNKYKQKKHPPTKTNKKSHHTSHHTPVTWRLWPSPPDLHNYAPFLSSLLFHFLSLSLHFLSCLSIQVSRVRDISGHPNIPICPGSRWHSGHYTWQQQSLTHLAACHQRGRQQAAARHSTTWDLGSYRHHKMHFGILSGQISDPTHLHCSFSLGVCFQCSRWK